MGLIFRFPASQYRTLLADYLNAARRVTPVTSA
jgi:hypothetical protein